MASTVTKLHTNKDAMNNATTNEVADLTHRVQLGTMLTPLKRTFTGLTSAAAQNLTLIDATGETTGVANPNRLAALTFTTLRVTAGAAAAGARFMTDVGGTPSTTVATLSDDGKTVTFEAAVTAFVAEYIPRPAVDMNSQYEVIPS
jgi:hypothetical protein